MNEATLIILAAGLGSRYGGLKQLDAFLPQQKTIIEYSIYDAYKAGFRQFVIVIKEENEAAVKKMIRHSFDETFKITYVYQTPLVERQKPLGTAHALYCCKDAIKGPLGIINGDDYYGYESFVKLYQFLNTRVDDQHYAMIGYRLENTLSNFGGVSRGICQSQAGYLHTIHECGGIVKHESQIECDEEMELTSDQIVSMNMWGLNSNVFSHIEHYLEAFLNNEYKKNPEKAEFYLPSIFDQMIQEKQVVVEIIKSNAKWYGVTYKEDQQEVIAGITEQLDHYQTDLKAYDQQINQIKEIAKKFVVEGEIVQVLLNQSGNINDSYQVITSKNSYLLQRINHHIFKDIAGLMNNMTLVTTYLSKMNRQTLEIIPTITHLPYLEADKAYYRVFKFINNSFTYDRSESTEDFYRTGQCFGNFFKDLNEFDASLLIETIPDFHNTPIRFKQFEKSLEKGNLERIQKAAKQINELQLRQPISHYLYDLYQQKQILQRVCHNDTKLSNILMDKTTKSPICVIDFDTIMPGFIAYDYGDALRSGANHTYEDNPDLKEVYFDLEMFEAFTKGFLTSLKDSLTLGEISSLVDGVKVMVYEQALRFLTDYLENDHYYKIQFDEHNLVRANNQIALLMDIEKKEAQMRQIVNRYK